MSQYSHYTYCSQGQPTCFGLRVSTNFHLEVSTQFGSKGHTRKINIHKDFHLFTNF